MQAIMDWDVDKFLLPREEAAERYGISTRALDRLTHSDPDFPVVRIGKRVLVHREGADAYFTRHIRERIELE